MSDDSYHDHYGCYSWKLARENALLHGGDLSPLVDMNPFDREVRLADLAGSNVPAERDLAEQTRHEDWLRGLPDDPRLQDALGAAKRLRIGTGRVPSAELDWRPLNASAGRFVMVGRQGGHVLVVRESGAVAHTYYPVVDGFHLSWRGGPSSYKNLFDAISAAMAAAFAGPCYGAAYD